MSAQMWPIVALAAAPAAAVAAPFSGQIEPDPESGLQVVVLRYQHPTDPQRSIEARIAPEVGANLFSLRIGDDELLAQPPSLGALARSRAGTPILFPTPNRVRDATFTFEGRSFALEANSGKNAIHGLVRHRAWRADPPVSAAGAATATFGLDWDDAQPDFARFPIAHRLEVTFSVERDGLRIAYAVHNKDEATLPFGFGLHPWFRVPGARGDVSLWVPARERMEAEEKLPTGKLLAVAGTPFDLRRPRALEGLDLDDVYFGMRPGMRAGFEWRDRGVRLTLTGSSEFSHLVVFTPPGQPFFCLENQTSSTDAHNLHARGLVRPAHLLVARKGQTARGWVRWRIDRTKAAR